MTTPTPTTGGTHRTPPDEHGDWVEVQPAPLGATLLLGQDDHAHDRAAVSLDALPGLVRALAAHLTVDARRALTRDLAAQDGDAVVAVSDAWSAVIALGGIGSGATSARLRAAVEAARPTPTPEETR